MAKEKEEKEQKTERELRWERLIEVYKKQNPLKYEAKKAAGKFDTIPATFQ